MFYLTETKHYLHPAVLDSIKATLRCNPNFDGYVFVPANNGKIKTGAYITEDELANRKLISDPDMVVYFRSSTQKFYKLSDKVKENDNDSNKK